MTSVARILGAERALVLVRDTSLALVMVVVTMAVGDSSERVVMVR